jgi:hypothetical protein
MMPKAKAAAMKALEIDANLAEAHASLGWAGFTYDLDSTTRLISAGIRWSWVRALLLHTGCLGKLMQQKGCTVKLWLNMNSTRHFRLPTSERSRPGTGCGLTRVSPTCCAASGSHRKDPRCLDSAVSKS